MTEPLENIFSGREAASGDTPPPAPQETTQAPEGQQPQTTETPTQETTTEGQTMVPVKAVTEERAKVKRYTEEVASLRDEIASRDAAWERRIAQLLQQQQPKQQAPDFFEDPAGFVRQQTQPVEQALVAQREQFSQLMAVEKHGEEAVKTAFNALQDRIQHSPATAQADYVRIMQSPHPYGELVRWHQQQQMLSEIGSDPAAYREKVKAELLSELQQQPNGATAQPQAAPVMPSNLAAARNVGTRSGPAWAGPQPLGSIFDMRRKPAG